MNKPFLTIIILLALTALVGWQYFVPVFNKTLESRQDLAAWRAKLDDTQGLNKKLEELKGKYASMTGEAEKVAQSITKNSDIPGLLAQLEELSSRNGLMLTNVSFSVADPKKIKKVQTASVDGQTAAASPGVSAASLAASGIQILAVDLNLTGRQNSLRSFLNAVESNLRIMDVTRIAFNDSGPGGSAASSDQDFKISLNAYFTK